MESRKIYVPLSDFIKDNDLPKDFFSVPPATLPVGEPSADGHSEDLPKHFFGVPLATLPVGGPSEDFPKDFFSVLLATLPDGGPLAHNGLSAGGPLAHNGLSAGGPLAHNGPSTLEFATEDDTLNYVFLPYHVQSSVKAYPLYEIGQKKVCLESLIQTDKLHVTGTILVRNLGTEKKVIVRYSTTEGNDYLDITAVEAPHPYDGIIERFIFTIRIPRLKEGQRVVAGIKYFVNGQEFWDTNDGNGFVICMVKK